MAADARSTILVVFRAFSIVTEFVSVEMVAAAGHMSRFFAASFGSVDGLFAFLPSRIAFIAWDETA